MSKEKCTYRIATTTGSVEVLGEEVEFPGFEEHRFFIRSPRRGEWIVSEFSTGTTVGSATTRPQALTTARKRLKKRGRPLLVEDIRSFRAWQKQDEPFEQIEYPI